MVSGKIRTLDLPITKEQIEDYESGTSVQIAFKNLTADQREFYMTGITDGEWDVVFPPEEDETDQYEIED